MAYGILRILQVDSPLSQYQTPQNPSKSDCGPGKKGIMNIRGIQVHIISQIHKPSGSVHVWLPLTNKQKISGRDKLCVMDDSVTWLSPCDVYLDDSLSCVCYFLNLWWSVDSGSN